MKNAKFYLAFSITLFIALICNAQSNLKTTVKDLEKLSGSWQGSLTYLDYSSGKPYTMPADIEVKSINPISNFFISNFLVSKFCYSLNHK